MTWGARPLSECIENVRIPAKVPRKSFLNAGAIPIVSQEADFINGYWNNDSDAVKVSSPMVIFGDHTQVLKLIDFDFVVGADGVKILKPKNFLDAKFLRYFLEANPFPSLGYARHYRHISKLEVPLPPLEEQERIVALLDQAFAALDRARSLAEANLADARSIYNSSLNLYVQEAIDQFGSTCLQDLCNHITDGDHSPPPKAATGVPFVTISNIDKRTGELNFDRTFFVPHAYYEGLQDSRKPTVGDLLYTVTGTLGVPSLVVTDRKFCFQRHVAIIKPKVTTSPEWLLHVLRSQLVLRQATDGSTGTAQKTVSLKALRGLRIPKIDAEAQDTAARKLATLWRAAEPLRRGYGNQLNELNQLRQSLLKKAFAGELT